MMITTSSPSPSRPPGNSPTLGYVSSGQSASELRRADLQVECRANEQLRAGRFGSRRFRWLEVDMLQ